MKLENVADIYPLSPVQEGMLFHCLNSPESGVYVGYYTCKLVGQLNADAFQSAWQEMVARYSCLRTVFLWDGLEQPLQIVREKVELIISQQDWQKLSSTEQEIKLQQFLQSDRLQGFDLAKAPLMRLHLIQLSGKAYQFIWTCHHLLIDGWSTTIIWSEVLKLYQAFSQGKSFNLKPSRPYRDYIAWLKEQNLSKAKNFWQDLLTGFREPTFMEVEQTNLSATKSYQQQQQIVLSSQTYSGLQSLARKHRLTLNTLIHGAWALLLSRYSGESDLVYGATVSGRPSSLSGVEKMVGLFINTLPMRVKLSSQELLLPWLEDLQAQLLQIREYEYTPLINIQQWSDIPSGQSLFEHIVVFENYPVNTEQLETKIKIDEIVILDRSHYPLALLVIPGEVLELKFIYDQNRFDNDVIRRMLGHLEKLLEGFVENPHRCLWEIPLLTDAERYQLIEEWNQTQTPYPQDICIHHLFAEQVQKNPKATAVIFNEQTLSYQELNNKANQLASYLSTLKISPNVGVGICLERSLEMIIGILGILKAGGAYIPLDPSYPSERIAYILEAAETPLILTQQKFVNTLLPPTIPTLSLDKDWQIIEESQPESDSLSLISDPQSDDLAYILFTSGSTGKPKGVKISHRNLVHSTTARIQYYNEPVERFLLVSSFAFDSSLAGIFWSLCQGGTLVLPRQKSEQDIQQLAKAIAHYRITHTLLLPSLYSLLLTYAPREKLLSLQTVIVAGESCGRSLALDHHQRLPHTLLYNEYGPTEASIWSSVYPISGSIETSSVPIGRPIANVQIYLLDSNLEPVPIGLVGEIYLGGEGVSPGYLNQSPSTTEAFIPHPFDLDSQKSLYRTGDLAKYNPDGNIEFVGRVNNQVKIRGFRIELAEIEANINQYSDIAETIVLARENHQGDKYLTAYIIPQNSPPKIKQLRQFLDTKLPDYMIPSAYVFLDSFPLTPNGKIDKKALPEPDFAINREEQFVPPRSEIEIKLAQIWQEVLGLKKVGINDNFFDLGGHSLFAIQVISKLTSQFGLQIPLKVLLEKPTINQLTSYLELQLNTSTAEDTAMESSVMTMKENGSKTPLYLINSTREAYNLANFLAEDQPLYNLNIFALTQRIKKPLEQLTIEDFAQYLIEDLQKVNPHGPYRFIAFCGDGSLALELAQQLQNQGYIVDLLCLIDVAFEVERFSLFDRLRLLVQYPIPYIDRYIKVYITNGIKKLILRELEEQLYQNYYRAIDKYKPSAHQGEILYLASTEYIYLFDDLVPEFEAIANKGLKFHHIKSLHTTLFDEPYIKLWLNKLQNYLEDLEN